MFYLAVCEALKLSFLLFFRILIPKVCGENRNWYCAEVCNESGNGIEIGIVKRKLNFTKAKHRFLI